MTINPFDYERRIKNQAESLVKSGHSVSVIALGKSEEDSILNWKGVTVKRIKTIFHRGGPFKFIHFNLKVYFYLLFKKFKVIHCHDLWMMPASFLLHLIKDFKLVYDAHEYYEGLEIFTRKRTKKNFWMLVEKMAMKHVDVLVTVSEPMEMPIGTVKSNIFRGLKYLKKIMGGNKDEFL